MLTVLTGLPGAGKTLYFLGELIKEFRGRRIAVYGIPNINHEHFGTVDLDTPEAWYDEPEGSVIVIDESQKVFPLRRSGSDVPKKCSEFETHRHQGFDVVLLTQDASTLDVHIRKLAGRHIHVHRLFGGKASNVYYYAEFTSNPASAVARKTSLDTKTFRFPKEVFEHYKSADLHTVKRQIPRKLILVPILGLALVGGIFYAFWTVTGMIEKYENEILSPGAASSSVDSRDGPAAASAYQAFNPALAFQASFIPTVPGVPWTAPAYLEALKVRTFPKPYCILYEPLPERVECVCYSQQVTRMKDIPVALCLELVNNGWFDFTKDEERSRDERAQRPARQASSGLGDSTGHSEN